MVPPLFPRVKELIVVEALIFTVVAELITTSSRDVGGTPLDQFPPVSQTEVPAPPVQETAAL
jgi:hypothetical protein